MKLRPCIDIHDGLVKQIVGSTLRDSSETQLAQNYVATHDAAWFASLYRQKQLPGGHVILLNPVSDEEQYAADRRQALAALGAYPGGMQAGGGITPETAGDFLDAGASHVIVTSYIFDGDHLDSRRLSAMEKAVGREHLVLDLSCRRAAGGEGAASAYHVVTNRWQTMTGLIICEETLDDLSRHCSEFLIHAADVEGRRGGIEKDLVRLLGQWQEKSHFPITYAGGVHAVEDLDLIRQLTHGQMDVTVGSALRIFGGDLDLDELAGRCLAEQPQVSSVPLQAASSQ